MVETIQIYSTQGERIFESGKWCKHATNFGKFLSIGGTGYNLESLHAILLTHSHWDDFSDLRYYAKLTAEAKCPQELTSMSFHFA